jgi:hypothetical protein
VATGGGLVTERAADGHFLVINTPPSAGRGASVVVCPAEGEPFEPAGLDAWGKRADGPPLLLSQQGRLNGLTVAQVQVQPPGCPQPFPGLMYVSRGLDDGQLVYSGGWIIDDAALYGRSTTVLSLVGTAQVVPVGLDGIGDVDGDGFGDFNGDGYGDVVARAGSSERARRGARLESGAVDGNGNITIEGLGGRLPGVASGDDGEDGESYHLPTHVAVDAPVLHLVNAASASNEVKFKAGAELSKAVN